MKRQIEEPKKEEIFPPIIYELSDDGKLRIQYHRSDKETNGDFRWSLEVFENNDWVVHSRRDVVNDIIKAFNVRYYKMHPEERQNKNDTNTD